jgi:hypothetical protein
MTAREPSFETNLAQVEQRLGAGFVENLTAAMGTEAAVALHGISVAGPTWTMVALTNNAGVIDSSVAKVVEVFNAALGPDEQNKRCILAQESTGGRVWHTMTAGTVPFGVTWTYDGDYLVAASDRATAERALATRSSGSALIWSPAFQAQLPGSAAIHPSAFAWLNTKGVLGAFSALSANPAVSGLLADRDPVLVMFDAKPEQIHAASRTRLAGVFVNAMLLGTAAHVAAPPAESARH